LLVTVQGTRQRQVPRSPEIRSAGTSHLALQQLMELSELMPYVDKLKLRFPAQQIRIGKAAGR
jgi:hypothetical protein